MICDVTLTGVGAENLDIRGVVRLPISLGKLSPPLHLDFYVMANLALPCDGLIGLPSLRAHGISVYPERHYAGRKFKALDVPERIASPWVLAFHESPPSLAAVSVHTAPARPSSASAPWNSVNVVIVGRHEVPNSCAYFVSVTVNAPVGSHVCIDAPSRVRSLKIEPSLVGVEEGHKTIGVVLNTSGASVLLKPGVLLTQALSYGTQVSEEALPGPSLTVGGFWGGDASATG